MPNRRWELSASPRVRKFPAIAHRAQLSVDVSASAWLARPLPRSRTAPRLARATRTETRRRALMVVVLRVRHVRHFGRRVLDAGAGVGAAVGLRRPDLGLGGLATGGGVAVLRAALRVGELGG